ncbi:MAG: hypothetical protein HQK65_20995 [Desulfamplus sp.]|nr:hypothetical protein [Desulfamplus sp.]
MEEGLKEIIQNEDYQDSISSPYGMKYVVEGNLKVLNGESTKIRTIWIIEHVKGIPRFVTAYPAKK